MILVKKKKKVIQVLLYGRERDDGSGYLIRTANPRTEALFTCIVARHVQWGRGVNNKNDIICMWGYQRTESPGAFMVKHL